MEEVIQYIADVGFPIMITMYLLIRLETKLEALTSSINELTSTLKK